MSRARPLTTDQLDALRCFSSFTEAVALVADPTAAAITAMKPVDGYWVAGAMSGGHIGPDGIDVTLRPGDHQRQVTVTVPELQAWSKALPDWVRTGPPGVVDDSHLTFFHQFTMARCANPTRPARHEPSTGTGHIRTIRICRTPWSKYAAIENVSRGMTNYGVDFPYPCRWCMRWVIYERTDPDQVDAAISKLRALGVVLEDTTSAPLELDYVGQGVLFTIGGNA